MPRRLYAILSILCLSFSVAAAQEEQPSVEDRIRKMSATLGAATMLTFEADIQLDDAGPNGQMVQYGRHASVMIRRPGELRAVVQGERENFIATIGNAKFSILDPARKIYFTMTVPDTLDASLPIVNEKKAFSTPLANFLLSNPHAKFLAQAQSSERVGTSLIDGVSCDHLAIRQSDTDIQLWLENNERSLPRKLNIIYKTRPGSPQVTATLSKWDLLPVMDDKTFEFQPPADAAARPLEDVHPANPAATMPAGK